MFIGAAAADKYRGFHPDTTDTECNTHNNNTVNFLVDTLEPEARYRFIIIITYLLTYLLTYLPQLSSHSVAVVLTPVQTKQIRINIHKRNNTKTQYKQYKTQ